MKSLLINIVVALVCISVGAGISFYFLHQKTIDTPIEFTMDGKAIYELGDIAEFTAKIKNAPDNLNAVVDWKVLNGDMEVNVKKLTSEDIIFPVGIKPAKMLVLMHASYIDPKKKDLVNGGFYLREVTIGNGPNPPIPPPNPTPTIPDGKYKIAQLAYTSAVSLVRTSNLAEEAKALAKSYNDTADEVNKGKYATLKDVYAGLKANDDAALGANKNNWESWDTALQSKIGPLHRNGELKTLNDHADLFREIATGLSYIK